MAESNYTLVLDTKNYTIGVDVIGQHGYFEHNKVGDELAGGLWFNNKMFLRDYDGVYKLPNEVRDALITANLYEESHLGL
jgi:hypothetical protein